MPGIRKRWLAVGLGLLLPFTATPGQADDGAGARSPAPASAPRDGLLELDHRSVGGPGLREVPPGSFIGFDGQQYAHQPTAVEGRDGALFIGEDFDYACLTGGAGFRLGVKHLKSVVRTIEQSGRRVVFAVAPNKSTILRRDLPRPLPQGSCARRSMLQQTRILDQLARQPGFVPTYRALRRANPSSPYWKTDAHWNTVGASVFAMQVAKQLDPQLATAQSYARSTRTYLGDLEQWLPDPQPETAPARLPTNGVKTRPGQGSTPFDGTFQTFQPDYSWVSTPMRRTWPGRTLLLGDSFTYTAMEPLQNLFHQGRFLWVGLASTKTLVDAIRDADTVVITIVQRFMTVSPLLGKEARAALRQRLGS